MQKYLALKASAGSGKTFALTVRYISLLLVNSNPSEILTLTFTNKASKQMNQKIYDTLFNLGDDENILNAISLQTKLTKQQILEKKEQIIQRFIISELSIFTIDKFVNKILREFSGYAEISDDFTIKQDDEELLFYKFLSSLDEYNFNNLVSFSYNEDKKIAQIAQIFKLLDNKNEKLEIKKFRDDSFNYIKNKILEGSFKIKDFVDNSNLSKSAKNAVDFNDINSLLQKGKTWLTKDSLKDFSYFKKSTTIDKLDEIFTILKQNITLYYQLKDIKTLNHLFTIYNNFKIFRDKPNKQINSLKFGDITNIVYKLLQFHIDSQFLYFRLDNNYSHILIDEFQDTSIMQYKILEPLIQEIISSNDDKFKTFFYVGDTKQSIYRFRGGTKELFDFVANQFNGMIKVEILDTNYRSSKNIIDLKKKF